MKLYLVNKNPIITKLVSLSVSKINLDMVETQEIDITLQADILLLDEAMSALDYQSRLAISDDIYKIIKKEGKTAIMVTHDIAEAISMSDRIIVLSKRPATVKKVYEINMQNKSTPIHNRKCKEFASYYDEIWRDLDVHI